VSIVQEEEKRVLREKKRLPKIWPIKIKALPLQPQKRNIAL
jgi:hypothetical protein